MKSMVIGARKFASKKEAATFVREILYTYAVGEALSDEHAEFMHLLLESHPESEQKIGAGVARFTVEQNMGSRGFWLHRIDDSKTDFSFLACLSPPTAAQLARRAFRHAIQRQIWAFRDSCFAGEKAPVCPIAGEVLTRNSSHVDHEIPFEEILQSFVGVREIDLANVRVNETKDGSTHTLLVDEELRRSWSLFHAQVSGLRLVSKRANLSILRRREQ